MTGIVRSIDRNQVQMDAPFGQRYLDKGHLVQGEVLNKSVDGSMVRIFNQDISLPSSISIVEDQGQKALFEVIQNKDKQVSLKYLRPDESIGSISDDLNEMMPTRVIKDYQKMVQDSIQRMDPEEMAEVQQVIKTTTEALETMTESMTDADLRQMMEDGMNPEKTSLEIVARVLVNNKSLVSDRSRGAIQEAVEVALGQLQDFYSDEAKLEKVARALGDANLPVTKKHVDKLMGGLNTLDDLKAASSEGAMQILDYHKNATSKADAPTLEQLYMNIHTVLPEAKALSVSASDLEAMVTEHLQNQGIEPTTDAIDFARVMVERGISITAEKLEFVQDPSSVMGQINDGDILTSLVSQLQASDKLTQIPIDRLAFINDQASTAAAPQTSQVEISGPRIEALTSTINLVQELTDAHVVKAVLLDRHHTLEGAVSVLDGPELVDETMVETSASDISAEALEFKKNLSVVQLKMTLEAALRLEQQDIKVDIAPIEKVVQGLEAQSEAMRQVAWQSYSGEDGSTQAFEDYKATMAQLDQLEMADESTAALLKNQGMTLTIRHYTEGAAKSLDDHMSQALKRQTALGQYDASMTQVRGDLGDRIEGTFDQIGPMLEDMALAVSQANVQAVQALARNSMAITEGNILDVQVIQEKINLISQQLTPLVVVQMTQAGINPLDMNVDELMSVISAYEVENQTTETSKISALILAMDQADQLSPEERQSMMGIYRSIDTVTRSKGAATGFMVKENMALTLNNLFEAAKYIRKTGQTSSAIQADVDDNFGHLQGVSNSEATLREQVRSGLGQTQSSQGENSGLEALRAELMDLRIKAFIQVLGQNSATALVKGDVSPSYEALPLEEVTALMDEQVMAKAGLEVKPDQYLAFIKENPDFLKTMMSSKIPMTLENFSKAITMNQDSFAMMHDLEAMLEHMSSPALKQAVIDHLSSAALSVLEEGEPYERLEEAMEDVTQMLRDAEEAEEATVYKHAASAKASINHTQLIQVTEDYYQIPVFINEHVTQLNMYILEDEGKLDKAGESKVIMSFDAGSMGRVQALMTLSGNDASLQIQSTHSEDRSLLQAYESAFRGIMDASNYRLSHIAYESFVEKEPIEIGQETMTRSSDHRVVEGHIEWSV